ncbi:MAG TPA: UDP-3-O-(3-hydroxymyristoyl)glucosamine N-acyltransferase [Thermoanaerobaculia bacterium]
MKAARKPVPAGRRVRGRDARGFTLGEVARAVKGKVEGDAALRLTGVRGLEDAGPDDLSFVADSKHAAAARESRAGAFLASPATAPEGRPAVVVAEPVSALALWLEGNRIQAKPKPGVRPGARVDRTARLGPGVAVEAGATIGPRCRIGARTVIGPGAFVGADVEIGTDGRLHANAVVYDGCRIGDRCVLHAGAVIGSDGFGYVWDGARHRKIPQVGIVRVEDDVEIGANAAIDRATLGETVVGRGTKIDNLVQVGHNVVIGEHSLLCGQAGVAGSTRIGRRVTLAGQAGVADHARIGDGAIATAQSGIVTGAEVEAGAVVSGMPAAPHREFLKRSAWVARLPELARRLERLERRLDSEG